MIVAEKPPLDDVYLAHFGKKGMRWGVRHKRPDEEQRKKFFTKERALKLGIGGAMLAGTAAAIYILNKKGDVKAADLMSERAINRYGPKTAKKGPFAQQIEDTRRRYQEAKAQVGSRDPSPMAMQLEAGRLRQQQAMQRVGNQRLTDKAWRDQANLNRMRQDMDDTTKKLLGANQLSLAELRNRFSDEAMRQNRGK